MEDLQKAEEELERQINKAITRSSKSKLVHHKYSLTIYLQELLKKKNNAKNSYRLTLHLLNKLIDEDEQIQK